MGGKPKWFGSTIIRHVCLSATLILLLAVLSGCGANEPRDSQATVDQPADSEGIESSENDPQPAPAKIYCPLDGALIEEMPVRPIAVTIDNNGAARPQTGLVKADLVYEIPVEGGITRYLAIFFHGDAGVVGPIRSARPYLMDIAREWDAVFVHVGQSPQAQVYFKKTPIDHLNEMYHSTGFWRDKSRKAPHNLYSSTNNLRYEMQKLGWNEQTAPVAFPFLKQGEIPTGTDAAELKINYPYGQTTYRYDTVTGTYLRFLKEKPYLDLASSVQLSASNIVLQQVPVRSFDAEGRLEVDLIGGGKAWLFSGGKAQEGTWVRESLKGRTRFFDPNGVELRFKTGQTWIHLVSKQTGFQF